MALDKFVQLMGFIHSDLSDPIMNNLKNHLDLLDDSWELTHRMIFGVFLSLMASVNPDDKTVIDDTLKKILKLLISISDDFVEILQHPGRDLSNKMAASAEECLDNVVSAGSVMNLFSLTICSIHMTHMPTAWVSHIEKIVLFRIKLFNIDQEADADDLVVALIKLHCELVAKLSRDLYSSVFILNSKMIQGAEEWATVVAPEFNQLIADHVPLSSAYTSVIQHFGAPWIDPADV